MFLEGIIVMLLFVLKAVALVGGWLLLFALAYCLYAFCRWHYEINEPKMSAYLK